MSEVLKLQNWTLIDRFIWVDTVGVRMGIDGLKDDGDIACYMLSSTGV